MRRHILSSRRGGPRDRRQAQRPEPFALCFHSHSSWACFPVTRCIIGSVFSDYPEGAAIFASVSVLLAEGGPSSTGAVALCYRSEARSGKRGRASCRSKTIVLSRR